MHLHFIQEVVAELLLKYALSLLSACNNLSYLLLVTLDVDKINIATWVESWVEHHNHFIRFPYFSAPAITQRW